MTRNDTRGGAVAEPEARRDTAAPNRKDVLQRQRDEFGGFQWGADFFGWLVAVGLATLLIALLAAAGAAVGLTDADAAEATDEATTIGIVGGVLLLIVLLVAYYFGGYVAGRMARFNGPRQGLGVWLIGLAGHDRAGRRRRAVRGRVQRPVRAEPPAHPRRRGIADHRGPDRARRGHRRHAARRDRRRQGRHPLSPQGRPSRPVMSTHNPKEASMATTEHDVLSWRGQNLIDSSGDKIGKIEEIYLDADSNAPEWALVTTGMFGTKQSFVPIQDATPATTATASASRSRRRPSRTLRRSTPTASSPSRRRPTSTATTAARTRRRANDQSVSSAGRPLATGERGGPGQDVSGQNTDEAMTVSEEELRVGTTEREAGRVRLKKYVVEEEVTKTVPVRREEVRLEREPITDANRDDATAGPEISEDEHEVVLHAEEAVVDKRAVPKERVRLEKDVTTERRDGLRHGAPGARRRRRLPQLATPYSDPGCGRGHPGSPEKPTAFGIALHAGTLERHGVSFGH